MFNFENQQYNGEGPGLREKTLRLPQALCVLGLPPPHVETEGASPDQGCPLQIVRLADITNPSPHYFSTCGNRELDQIRADPCTGFPWQTLLIHHSTISH